MEEQEEILCMIRIGDRSHKNKDRIVIFQEICSICQMRLIYCTHLLFTYFYFCALSRGDLTFPCLKVAL